jgi:tetratricopeptide (TPR) repeat protein
MYELLKKQYMISGDKRETNKALGHMALNKEALGEFETALALYQDQGSICKESGFKDDLAWALSNQGDVLRKLGRLENALECYTLCKKVSDENNFIYWQKRSRENMGEVWKDRDQNKLACEQYQEMEKICREDSSQGLLAGALENQADIFYKTGKLEKSIELYSHVGELYKKSEELYDQWRVLTKCAVLYDTIGNTEQYAQVLQKKQELIPFFRDELLFAYLLQNQDHLHTIRFDLDLIYDWYGRKQILKELTGKMPKYAQGLVPRFNDTQNPVIQVSEFSMIKKLVELSTKNKFGMALQYFYGFAGLCEFMNGRVDAAIGQFSNQKEQCAKIKYIEGQQIALGRLADIFLYKKDLVNAQSCIQEQEQLIRNLNTPDPLLKSNQKLIDLLINKKDLDAAGNAIDTNLKTAEGLSLYQHKSVLWYKKGIVGQMTNSMEESARCFQRLEDLSSHSNDRYFRNIALLKEAEVSNRI